MPGSYLFHVPGWSTLEATQESPTQDFLGPPGLPFLSTMSKEEGSLAESQSLDLNSWLDEEPLSPPPAPLPWLKHCLGAAGYIVCYKAEFGEQRNELLLLWMKQLP